MDKSICISGKVLFSSCHDSSDFFSDLPKRLCKDWKVTQHSQDNEDAGEVKPRTGEQDRDGIQLPHEEETWGSNCFVCFSARKAGEEAALYSLNRTGWDCD